MAKNILAIGIELATDEIQEDAFGSRTSLLDWDIVIFRPDIHSFVDNRDDYLGKPCLNDASSFRLKECCEHWRREIQQAIEAGKTVVVFLPPLQEVYIATGERTHSGTGRNQKTTRIVDLYSNYDCLPVNANPVTAKGSAMKLTARGAEVLASYWAEFSSQSEYHVILTADDVPACVVTRAGDKAVGALKRSKNSAGSLILLPDLGVDSDHFVKEEDEENVWTDEARQFAARLLSSIVALDKALRSAGEVTPEPAWANAIEYTLESEQRLRVELLAVEQRVEEVQRKKEELLESLRSAGRLRGLLYEKGKPLEDAIIRALRLLGFKAESYKDTSSEFDVVFESAEGRLIGEAEGKDNKAINVDKLRQLAMNIHEDLQREEVLTSAKAVLFGNGYRLSSLHERTAAFTEKCVSAAKTSSTALVATADLFKVAHYLADNDDEHFATQCRTALLSAIGLVSFPEAPMTDSEDSTPVQE